MAKRTPGLKRVRELAERPSPPASFGMRNADTAPKDFCNALKDPDCSAPFFRRCFRFLFRASTDRCASFRCCSKCCCWSVNAASSSSRSFRRALLFIDSPDRSDGPRAKDGTNVGGAKPRRIRDKARIFLEALPHFPRCCSLPPYARCRSCAASRCCCANARARCLRRPFWRRRQHTKRQPRATAAPVASIGAASGC